MSKLPIVIRYLFIKFDLLVNFFKTCLPKEPGPKF